MKDAQSAPAYGRTNWRRFAVRDGFRRWRHSRLYWGGFFLTLSGLEMFLNLGGWIAGMLLGIVGGALVIVRGPRRKTLLIVAPLLLATSVLVAVNRPVQAADRSLPLAGAKPGVVKAASMTMYNSSYDGVAEVPTRNGPIRSLKFTMDKVVTKSFSLTIDEPGDAVTVIESSELLLDGNVEFYSPSFKGKLFGLTPVVFTPEQPPPPTLPVLWFTDVTLDLAYASSDALTAKALDIGETDTK